MLLKALRRTAFGVVCVIAVAMATGAIYQFIATRLDDGKYPPPGQLVDIDGRSLHVNCTGEGKSTVILESGLGGGSLDWSLVQPEVAKFARVCSYDRAGFAWSTSGGGRRNAGQITEELHMLLEAAHVPPPYVLVGHSIGGVHAQLFAARHHDEVAGVVLVDSSHQDQLSRMRGIPSFLPVLLKTAVTVGVVRVVNKVLGDEPGLPADVNAERVAMYSRTRSVFSIADEMAAIPDSLAELRATPMQLGDKPLVVLSRGQSEGTSPETEEIWRDFQSDLTKRSSNGSWVIAQKSGHYIQFSEPELVIEAIRQVSRAAASKH